MNLDLQQKIMRIIVNSGSAKNAAMEAIQLAKTGDFKAAQDKLDEANQASIEAHHAQTEMLTIEAQGEEIEVNLLLIHSQDHLMTTITFIELARELIELHIKIYE